MKHVIPIALNTFREAVRDRVLYGVFALALGVLAFVLALAELSLNEEKRVVTDLGIASVSFFAVVMAIFLGSSLLYKEIDKKTLYVILPKPLSRAEFFVGKYLGILLTVFVFVTMMGAMQCVVTALQYGISVLAVVGLCLGAAAGAWAIHRWTQGAPLFVIGYGAALFASAAVLVVVSKAPLMFVLGSLVLVLGEVAVLAAVALFFSAFSTPFLTGLLTTGMWMIGRSADQMSHMQSRVLSPEVRLILKAMAEIVPNFNLFVPGRHVLLPTSGFSIDMWRYIMTTMGYGMVYTTLLLVVGFLIFRKRDFT